MEGAQFEVKVIRSNLIGSNPDIKLGQVKWFNILIIKVSIWLYLHYLTLLYVTIETHLSINVFRWAAGVFLRAVSVRVVGLMIQFTTCIYIWYIMEHKMRSI